MVVWRFLVQILVLRNGDTGHMLDDLSLGYDEPI